MFLSSTPLPVVLASMTRSRQDWASQTDANKHESESSYRCHSPTRLAPYHVIHNASSEVQERLGWAATVVGQEVVHD